jgi:simple sugar transport system permease protein
VLYEREMADGSWVEITLPVLVMIICVAATWFFITRTTTGRQLYAFGDNPEGARRFGINIAAMQFIAFGWLGLMAGIGGLIQAHYAQEVVPNALYGRELDVLAAVVLGGARLGGGKGSVLGCVLGVLLISITQNGLNLAGVSPFAFKMIIGAIILVAITLSNTSVEKLLPFMRQEGGRK